MTDEEIMVNIHGFMVENKLLTIGIDKALENILPYAEQFTEVSGKSSIELFNQYLDWFMEHESLSNNI